MRGFNLAASLGALALLAASAPASAQTPGDGAPWTSLTDAAGHEMLGCYGANDPAACARMISLLEQAIDTPGIPEGERRGAMSSLLHTAAVHGEALVKKRDYKGALSVVQPRYVRMANYPSPAVRNQLALINMPLQQVLVEALIRTGASEAAQRVRASASEVAQGFYDARSRATTPQARRFLADGLTGMAGVEAAAGEAYGDSRADGSSALAMAAYVGSESWLDRAMELGLDAVPRSDHDLLLGRVKYEEGQLLEAKRLPAKPYYQASANLVCGQFAPELMKSKAGQLVFDAMQEAAEICRKDMAELVTFVERDPTEADKAASRKWIDDIIAANGGKPLTIGIAPDE